MSKRINVSVADFQEHTGTVLHYLNEDMGAFVAFDPDLGEAKKAKLQALYEKSLTVGTDRKEIAHITEKTIEVNMLVAQAKELLTTLSYFGKKCFAERKDIQKELGIMDYRNALRSQSRFIPYLFEVAQATQKYNEDLLSVGLPENVVAQLQPLAENLNTANTEQESRKNARKVSTVDRSDIRMKIYQILGEYNDAAAIVFAADPVRRERYLLPNGNRKNTSQDEEDE